jgi:hypothetical protein
MKKILILTVLQLAIFYNLFSQTVYDYKIKDELNDKTRTTILNTVRNSLRTEYKQDFIFTVEKLRLCNGYAWFTGQVQRADGKEIVFPTSDIPYDCCHTECLLQIKKGKWYILEIGSFSTDVWYEGIWDRHKAPRKLYGNIYLDDNYE